jgi:hypothetical protein
MSLSEREISGSGQHVAVLSSSTTETQLSWDLTVDLVQFMSADNPDSTIEIEQRIKDKSSVAIEAKGRRIITI